MEDIMGVNEGEPDVPFFGSSEGSTPEPNEEKGKEAASEQPKNEGEQESSEVAPKKDLESNIQAIRKQLNQFKQENEKLKNNPYEQALRGNPDLFNILLAQMNDPKSVSEEMIRRAFKDSFQAAQPKVDPYAEYEPLVAEKLRKVDELERNFQETQARQKQEQEQYQQRSVEQNMSNLEAKFDSIIESKYPGLPEQSQLMIASHVKQILDQGLGDARFANVEQLNEAIRVATESFESLQKYSLGKMSKNTIPASGSGQGIVPAQTKPKGAEGRIASFADLV